MTTRDYTIPSHLLAPATTTITCPRCGTTFARTQGAYETFCSPACRERDRKRRRRQRRAVAATQRPVAPDLDAARAALWANRERNAQERRSREASERHTRPSVAWPRWTDPAMRQAARAFRERKHRAERARWDAAAEVEA